jgi:fructosamine-3-kinase
MDLAMTTLFGGFDAAFYEAYFHHAPQPAHYRRQWDTCNLYPLLVHLNLFGSGYLAEIDAMLRPYR